MTLKKCCSTDLSLL